MSDHDQRDIDPVEAVLKRLTPAPPALNRDRLMFRAGQVSRRVGWQVGLLTAVMGVLAGTGGTYFGLRAVWQPEVRTEIVIVREVVPVEPPTEQPKKIETPAASVPSQSTELTPAPAWDWFVNFAQPAGSYLQMRDQALRWGVEALPHALPSSAQKHQPLPTNLLKMQAELIESTFGS